MRLIISQLNIYPVKSLAGISLKEARVEAKGLEHDRRWMLVDPNHAHMTQRKYPVMALLQPTIVNDKIIISHKHQQDLTFSFGMEESTGEPLTVTVWGQPCTAREVSKEASAWFSKVIGTACQLVNMPEESVRPTDPEHSATPEDKVSFADGYPIMVFDEASVKMISEKSGEDIPLDRFRGNIITQGGYAHVEDELKRFSINDLDFHGAKPCTRCILTTIDQETGTQGQEPLKTLAKYRKTGNKIKFGLNVIPLQEGMISVGDSIVVKESIEPITF